MLVLQTDIAKSPFRRIISSFSGSQEGVTAIEYGLIAALIGIAIVTAATGVGTKLADLFNTVAGKL